jgi:1,4-alpha-glucan branching enzyme
MWAHPGKKLLFMGQEIGQYEEWSEKRALRWDLLAFDYHRKLQEMVRELNRLYRSEPALYEVDFHWEGFAWVDLSDVDQSVISFLRFARDRSQFLLFVCNFTPVVRQNYRVGVPHAGPYREIFNSDAGQFGGGNVCNTGTLMAWDGAWQNQPAHVTLTLPPLGVAILKAGG